MRDPNTIEPTEKQINACMMILERIGECDCDDDGTPCFEKSMAAADKFIKQNPRPRIDYGLGYGGNPDITAGDWGGIPNH